MTSLDKVLDEVMDLPLEQQEMFDPNSSTSDGRETYGMKLLKMLHFPSLNLEQVS